MIENDHELEVTQERIFHLERQEAQMRRTESNTKKYLMAAGGLLAEVDRMNLEIRDYLRSHPAARSAAAV
jgi:hypothetical protein